MKYISTIFISVVFMSCIPVKIAPKFNNEGFKVISAKKFKRKLQRQTSFIFKDPKDADEFYNYINKKFRLNHKDVGLNVPFKIDGDTFYLSYYETEKEDKTLNLPLVLVDMKRESNENSKLFENNYITRKGHWYIIITVYDKSIKNTLTNKHHMKSKVIAYLKNLKEDYLSTQNYEELLFKS